MLCTDASFVNADEYDAEVRGLRCKRWSCEICKPYNRLKVMHKAKSGRPNLFLTLTSKPDLHASPADAARDMVRGLVLLRRRIARRWKVDKLPFIVVFEATKKGWPHMHLLLRAPYMHWKVLRAMWQEITGAFEIDIRYIKKASQVLFYVTKYIGKDLHKFDGCKRWWRSHNYQELSDDLPAIYKSGLLYTKVEKEFSSIVAKAEDDGWIIENVGRFAVRIRPPPKLAAMRIDGAIARLTGYVWR